MSAKELKLGWTVSETIGVAVVNPRGVTGMKAIPKFNFQSDKGGIEIRQYSIEITGSTEAAAKAFAEEILSKKSAQSYFNVIRVDVKDNKYTIALGKGGSGLISPEVWAEFKKNVERICNDLKAFL